jgi:hypothetical protein
MKSPDPSSLQNLNDIVLPAAVGWWPLASGWYFLLGFLLLVLGWFGYRSLRRWINNRYRRAALHELTTISESLQCESERTRNLRQIPGLLKRTALSAYPRNEVASLSGKDWYGFLNSTLVPPLFTKDVTNTLDTISYTTGTLNEVDSSAANKLLSLSRRWVKQHQPATDLMNSGEA